MTKLSVEFGGYTTAGVKSENQDAFAAYSPSGNLLEYKGAVAVIADGLSSSENAKIAARTCATNFIDDYFATPDSWGVERSASKVVQSLNAWCFAQSCPGFSQHHPKDASGNMLTTLTSVIVKGANAHIFHVGDTRLYRWQGGVLESLTRDHKQTRGNQTYLTRAIGVDTHIDVDHIKIKLQKEDVLILTSDGVHDFISNKTLTHLMGLSHINLETKAKDIVNCAHERGSDDNLSCLLVKIHSLPGLHIDELYQQLSSLVIPPPLEVGNKIDQYEVLDILFSGTRSYLYKVKCLVEDKIYALKAPSINFRDDIEYLRGFSQEQWIGQRINHRNVMKVLPRSQDSKFLYHLCEYIKGQTLRQWMIDNPLPSLDQVRQILKPSISALRTLQRLDMVHRDLKPENIMISHTEDIKLIDFGTIKVASLQNQDCFKNDKCVVGSVNYVAPESLLHQQSDHRSDIYSLGVIAYEMLSNQLPYKPFVYKDYRPKSLSEWKYIPLHKTQCDQPQWVDKALLKATEPHPERRYQAFSELLMDLQRPNKAHLQDIKHAPFIERNPLLFWKTLCGLLVALNVILLWFNAQK